jgi:hypothetical protein
MSCKKSHFVCVNHNKIPLWRCYTSNISSYGFLQKQGKTTTKARWHRGANLKQLINEAYNNAMGCKMTMTSPLKLAKIVNEEEQYGGAHLKL